MVRSTDQIKATEEERLSFVLSRSGHEAAMSFARQTIGQYRSALRSSGYGREYRRELIASLVVLRAFVRNS